MNHQRSGIALVIVGAASFLLAAAPATDPSDAPDPGWRQGPIRYILIVKEDQEFKGLATDEDRAAFIERFWAALDPTPGTPENERRAEFWERVEGADRLFQEGLAPGWRSERGRFYILLGPPDQRENHGSDEVWKYVALPNPETDPEVMIRFRRNSEGEYHVGASQLEYWDPSQESDGPAAGDTFLAVRTRDGRPEMMKGRIRMTGPAAVQADYTTTPLDCSMRRDFYRVNRKSTRMVVTLALPRGQFKGKDGVFQAPDMTLSVAIDDARKGRPIGSFTEPMHPAGGTSASGGDAADPDRPILLQGAFTIEPGDYRGVFTVLDRNSHRGLRRIETFEAPDFGRGLALSSVALGRLRSDRPQDAGSGAGEAGGSPLIPEPGTTYHPGETVLFSYEVYNAELKGGTKPDIDVTYDFLVEGKTGPRQVARPAVLHRQSSTSLGYSLPLSGWPPGSYRLRVTVTDNRSKSSASREATFEVVRD